MPQSADRSLAEFAAALASLDPSPGASCASAVPAALAAALVAMVARQTTASDPFTNLAFDMESVKEEADALRVELLALAEEDVEAPLRVCELSRRVLELAVEVAERGHPYVAVEAGTAAVFAAAALESVALSVELELSAIEDEGFRVARACEAERARDRACSLRAAALAAVQERLESWRVVHG